METEHPEEFVRQLWSDKSWVLDRVSKRGLDLRDAAAILKNDRDVVTIAVSQDGRALQFAGEALRADPEVVNAALSNDVRAFQHVGPPFRDDRELALRLIGTRPELVKLLSPTLMTDLGFLLDAIASTPGAMRYVDQAHRSSKEFALSAVERNGLALAHLAPALRGGKAIVMAAVQQNGLALQCADRALLKDGEVLFEAVAQNCAALKYVHPDNIGQELLVIAMRSQQWSSDFVKNTMGLEPMKIRKNPFQVAPLPAMLCSLSELRLERRGSELEREGGGEAHESRIGDEEMLVFHAQLGLNGADYTGSLSSQATVEELGLLLRDACQAGPYIHVALPDGRALRWMDAEKFLKGFVE